MAVIDVNNLSVGYADKKVLNSVSFQADAGELIGIIGSNGAGKSTLLKAIRGFLPAKTGVISINGVDSRLLSQKEFARKIAYLRQGGETSFNFTAEDVVFTGRYPYKKWWTANSAFDKKIVQAAMTYTGVKDLQNNPIKNMSGGQRQRVFLAKALAQQTPVMLLDEPATGLDLFYQEEIFRFCRELCGRGKLIIMVVHELSLAARFCSRLLLLGQGKILADGIADEVCTSENLTKGYRADIVVDTSPLTGHKDIYTLPKENMAKDQLLEVLLSREL